MPEAPIRSRLSAASAIGCACRVSRRLLPTGLRAQLALAIALVTAVAVGASFLALYSGTGARLRSQIDSQLQDAGGGVAPVHRARRLSTPAALERTAQRFIASQRYHAESLINVVQVNGGRTVSNTSEVLAREEAREWSASDRTARLAPGSRDRIGRRGREYAGARAADHATAGGGSGRYAWPTRSTPVQQAQSSLRRTFLVVGLVALVLAIAAGIGLAALIAAPLRRITRGRRGGDARATCRCGQDRSPASGEVGVLAEAFDGMLERLERAFRRQRDFVSDASHELRTPLSVLRAQVELLDRETDERSRHEGTATLLRRLDELDRLVGDMLTLASAEAGQLVESRAIDLDEFFEDLRRDLPLFGERDFRLQPVAGTLKADPDRLTQVLRNLVRNAVAHTKPRRSGERRLTAATADSRSRSATRAGHPARGARADLRAIPPARSQPLARSRRQRPRPRDRTRDRRSPWGTDPRRILPARRHLSDRAARLSSWRRRPRAPQMR